MSLKRSRKLLWGIFLLTCVLLINGTTIVFARVELGGDSNNNETSKEIELPKLTGLKADTITTDSITVSWTPDTERHAIQVAISDKDNITPEFPTTQTWVNPSDLDNPQYKFENLTPNTFYYIRIRFVQIESAYPRVGLDLFAGDPSDILKVKTLSETSETETNNSDPSIADSSAAVFTIGSCKYTVNKNQVTVTAPKSQTSTKLTIPTSVKVKGKSVPVTAIAPNAFKGMTKLKTVTIGKNIKTIGKNAFRNCKKLKTITIKTSKLTSSKVGANAFKGIYSKATIKVPKKKLTTYKKLLKKKGIGKKVKITK